MNVNLTFFFLEKFSKILAFSFSHEELWPLFSRNNINILNNLILKYSRANIILIIVYFAKQAFHNKGQSLIYFPYPLFLA